MFKDRPIPASVNVQVQLIPVSVNVQVQLIPVSVNVQVQLIPVSVNVQVQLIPVSVNVQVQLFPVAMPERYQPHGSDCACRWFWPTLETASVPLLPFGTSIDNFKCCWLFSGLCHTTAQREQEAYMDTEIYTDPDVPWKRRFLAPAYLVSELPRHDPTHGIVLANPGDRQRYYTWNRETGLQDPVLPAPGCVPWTQLPWAAISPSGRFIYSFLATVRGVAESSCEGHFIRRPFNGGQPEILAPGLGPLCPMGFALAGNGQRLGFLRSTGQSRKETELYCIDLDQEEDLGPACLVAAGSGLLQGLHLSADGRLAFVVYKVFGGPDQGIRVTDLGTGNITASLSVQGVCFEACAVSPVPGDPRVVLMREAGSRISALVWNYSNGNIDELPYEGDHGSLRIASWSPDGERLLIDRFEKARQTLIVHSIREGTGAALPFHGRSFCSYFTGAGTVFVHRSDTSQPSRIESYRIDGLVEYPPSLPGQVPALPLSPPPADSAQVVLAASGIIPCRPWKEVWFDSSDGTPVQGWLCLPDGQGPFPTMVDIHGGPFLARAESYQPEAQAWADNGYAWLSVNYRGSVGFGSDFSGAISGAPGKLELEDLEAARAWLLAGGLAQPGNIFLTGWSYGAFLALLALGLKPALWAGAAVGNAMADWTLGHGELDAQGKASMEDLFGGSPEDKPDVYASASPITYASSVVSPCLVLQARDDGITTPRQFEAYEDVMKVLGNPIEVHWYDGGHGSHHEDSRLALELFTRMLAFVASIRSSN
jgi:dienelactone hydrolase